jgi:hypothetical protein
MQLFCKRCDITQPEGLTSRKCYYCGKMIPEAKTEEIPPTLRDGIPAPKEPEPCQDECSEMYGSPMVVAPMSATNPHPATVTPYTEDWDGSY